MKALVCLVEVKQEAASLSEETRICVKPLKLLFQLILLYFQLRSNRESAGSWTRSVTSPAFCSQVS